VPLLAGAENGEAADRLADEREAVSDAVAAWTLRVPRVRGGWESLRRAFDRSIADLAALRMRTGESRRPLFAAGMPWFMAVFGRDTAITSLQTLLLGPELAVGALEALAELQAREEDPTIDAEPGKIVHEVRHGRAAQTWFPRYYGSVDSTPLFLVLLGETWRWTDDATLPRRLREPALLALEWIDRYGDRDRDGFVEYARRVEHGLANQSWKDSGDSQRFHDGRFAEAPIAPVEVQGYVYDAKRRLAEIAREVWRDRGLAERLERDADELRARFDERFWVPERGGFYALALDGEKRPVDSRCSNMGHLLWSGIVPPERVPTVVDQLLTEQLWSGWGIRTMASDEAAYNPLSYHNGTVWPHDTALAAWGLARHGYVEAARRVARALVEAAGHFEWSLPEVFAGYARDETPFPIAYPTAARPQAWAAGTPILLVRVLLGLEPDRVRQRLVTTVSDELPSWLDGLRIEGVRAFGRPWTVAVERGAVTIAEGV
ncbi:MAG TPA: amylo-alpha-1,6-glucosidase, partial [Gaiellaceae bacterium]|nr:amylo-alpha-1,6-glucosidase [Gaiellaceae bacterium]